jgi:hypothetical protein
MTETLTLRSDTTIGNGSVDIRPDAASLSAMSPRSSRRVPFFITRDQAYFWSWEWQEGEAEADEELQRGEARVFDDLEEALRWLDSPED